MSTPVVPAPPYTLTVEPAGWTVPCEAHQTLREAAAAAGIVLPTSCRAGTCRHCMSRLRAGQVRYRVDWPGLSAEEKAEGWTLPCVAIALTDVTLEAPAASQTIPP